jgi:hypothetical protein
MEACKAVLNAARIGVRADNAEECFAEIRSMTGTDFSDAKLAEAVRLNVCEGLIRDPIRLLPQHLQCFWQLELAGDQ